jgi:hypothetical protein
MTRANLAALRLDFEGAFYMHPLFFFSGIVLFIILLTTHNPPIAHKKSFTVVCAAVGALFIAVYIVRMIYMFPDTVPLDYRTDSLWGIIKKWLLG